MGRATRKRRALGLQREPVPVVSEPAVARTRVLAVDAWRGLDELAVICDERRLLDSRIEALVIRLAVQGLSWGEIGRCLGMSRQGARQRYGARVAATTVVVS